MPDKNDFRNNPRSFVLELIDEGQLSYEDFAQMAVSALGGDAIQEMLSANNHAPQECQNCETFVDEEGDLCEDCQAKKDRAEFIEEQDEDEIDVEALAIDIENDNFDIECDDVEKYNKVEKIQKALDDGQGKQAREYCEEYEIEYRDAIIERLDRGSHDYEIFHLPSWSLSAIVNGDFSGIDDNQDDVDAVNDFLKEYKGWAFSQLDSEAEGYFHNSPEFGLATIVVEYVGIHIND